MRSSVVPTTHSTSTPPTTGTVRSSFHPRLVPGGVILLDDHGFTTCPGATRAAEEYMAGRPESIIQLTTGQAFIVKGADPVNPR